MFLVPFKGKKNIFKQLTVVLLLISVRNSKTLYLARTLNTPVTKPLLRCGLVLIATKGVSTTCVFSCARLFALYS
jgi:hypothetical protein